MNSNEGTGKGDKRQSGSELSPFSHEVRNGIDRQPEKTNNSNKNLPTEKGSNKNVPLLSQVVSVEKTDCASSPIHIPSKSEIENVNHSSVNKTDCASSPIHIPSKSEKENVNHSSVNKTDCATSPFPSPTKSTIERCEAKENQSELIDASTIPLPTNLGSELIEEVRRNTALSYEKSTVAVETVLGHLGYRLPELAPVIDRVCCTLHEVGGSFVLCP